MQRNKSVVNKSTIKQSHLLQLIEDIAQYAAWLSKENRMYLRVETPEIQKLVDIKFKERNSPAYRKAKAAQREAYLNWMFSRVNIIANKTKGGLA